MARKWLVRLLLIGALSAQDPPADLATRVARRESESEAARAHYTYRQVVVLEELDSRGVRAGEYRETRDIVFSPDGERTERVIGKPVLALVRLRLTEEDFRDIREVQPMLLSSERLSLYQVRFKGEEPVEGLSCWVLEVKPRQILDRQRLFEGLLWIDKNDGSIVRSAGRAVPQIFGTKYENLFPRFTTIRRRMDSGHWFPLHTHADDTLPFRTGPLRIRMTIRYSDYRRFSSESTVTFDKVK